MHRSHACIRRIYSTLDSSRPLYKDTSRQQPTMPFIDPKTDTPKIDSYINDSMTDFTLDAAPHSESFNDFYDYTKGGPRVISLPLWIREKMEMAYKNAIFNFTSKQIIKEHSKRLMELAEKDWDHLTLVKKLISSKERNRTKLKLQLLETSGELTTLPLEAVSANRDHQETSLIPVVHTSNSLTQCRSEIDWLAVFHQAITNVTVPFPKYTNLIANLADIANSHSLSFPVRTKLANQIFANRERSIRLDEEIIDRSTNRLITTKKGPIVEKLDALAYLLSQAPSTYVCIFRILFDLRKRLLTEKWIGRKSTGKASMEDWIPKRILDFGSGPGTTLWAIEELFPPESINHILAVDLSQENLSLAKYMLTQKDGTFPFQSIEFKRYLPLYSQTKEQFDLTIASFSISELPDKATRKLTLDHLWNHCSDILVIIERGTPQGFSIIHEARSHFLSKNYEKMTDLSELRPIGRLKQYPDCEVYTVEESQEEDAFDSIIPHPELKDHADLVARNQQNKTWIAKSDSTQLVKKPISELHIVAPCSSEGACPIMVANDLLGSYQSLYNPNKPFKYDSFCHFIQLGETSHVHSAMIKQPDLAYLGNNYSYLVIRRGPRPHLVNDVSEKIEPLATHESKRDWHRQSYAWGRVLSVPQKNPGHIMFHVCTPQGTIEQWSATKSQGKDIYKLARKLRCGDQWPLKSKSKPIDVTARHLYSIQNNNQNHVIHKDSQ